MPDAPPAPRPPAPDRRPPAGPRIATNLVPSCDAPRREESLRAADKPLGIESVEAHPGRPDRLTVHFFHDVPPAPQPAGHGHRHRGPSHAPVPGMTLVKANVRVESLQPGGCPIELAGDPEWCRDDAGFAALEVELARAGGSGPYRLSLVEPDPARPDLPGDDPHAAFDPLYSFSDFSFSPEDPGDGDSPDPCSNDEDAAAPPPLADYLARDYQTYRSLMLDRLAQTIPGWGDRDRPADLWTTLVEAVAYEADHLSYAQDAVAAEAYLGTARRRSSVRRHVRLVDDTLHDGCNARTWIVLEAEAGEITLTPPFAFFTDPSLDIANRRTPQRLADLASFEQADRAAFEPMGIAGDVRVYADHNAIAVHTWGDSACRLPRGATSASLVGRLADAAQADQAPPPDGPELHLKPGDLLLFEEVKGSWTGLPADADPTRRHAVRLRRVVASNDRVSGTDVVEVAWDEADALPFALCLSAVGRDGRDVEGITVARGNVLLVDHGLTLPDPEDLSLRRAAAEAADDAPGGDCLDPPLGAPWPRRPEFSAPQRGPITRAVPFPDPSGQAARQARQLATAPDGETEPARRSRRRLRAAARGGCVLPMARVIACSCPMPPTEDGDPEVADVSAFLRYGPATEAFAYDPAAAVPTIALAKPGAPPDCLWSPRPDLIESGPTDRHFVVETETDPVAGEVARLLFGDGDEGRIPTFEATRPLQARYRIGNGTAGNVGPGAIVGLLAGAGPVPGVTVRNPLPSQGGVDPRSTEEARRLSPTAFRRLAYRAVAPDDYARLAEQHPAVQQAAAEAVWTGTGYEMRVAVDLLAPGGRVRPGVEVEAILAEIAVALMMVRRIGHDVRVVLPRYVPLALAVTIYLEPDARADSLSRAARAAIRRRLAPDALTFGQAIVPSVLVADLQALDGVCAARVDSLRPTFGLRGAARTSDEPLTIDPLAIARMDDDARRPDRGSIAIETRGGR